MIPDAPPSYDEYVGLTGGGGPGAPPPPAAAAAVGQSPWALAACAADPAMRRAFLEAGASRGWVGGAKVRRYCEREGLMRSGEGGPGVAKGVLACAWELADAKKDARGLSFDEFCVFMHLLCIATAGGSLPQVLPAELVPPSLYGGDAEYVPPPPDQLEVPVARSPPSAASASAASAPPDAPPPLSLQAPLSAVENDEALARSLQETFDEENGYGEAPLHPSDRAADPLPTGVAEPLPVPSPLVEFAYEHERLASNGQYAAAHLIPGADPLPWRGDVPSGSPDHPVAATSGAGKKG